MMTCPLSYGKGYKVKSYKGKVRIPMRSVGGVFISLH